MKLAIIALGGALLLAGCAGTTTKIDETLENQNVQSGIQLACATYTGIKAGYAAYAENHDISDKTAKIVAGVTAGVDAVCTAPYPASTADLIAKVTQAGVAVFNALQEERRTQEAAAG